MPPARLAAILVWLPAALAASGTSSRSRRHQAPPPPAPPDAFAFDDDVLSLLSGMSLKQKVGQMTQIDVTQLVSYTGSCPPTPLEDPVNCQPELNYDRLRSSMVKLARSWVPVRPPSVPGAHPPALGHSSRPDRSAMATWVQKRGAAVLWCLR